LTAENSNPNGTMASPGQTIQIAHAAKRSDEDTKSAAKCGQIYGDPFCELRPLRDVPGDRITDWHQTTFFGGIITRDGIRSCGP
jgi:hypothetical protein